MICNLCGQEFTNLKNHIIESHSNIQITGSSEFYKLTDKEIYYRYKRIGFYFIYEKDVNSLVH